MKTLNEILNGKSTVESGEMSFFSDQCQVATPTTHIATLADLDFLIEGTISFANELRVAKNDLARGIELVIKDPALGEFIIANVDDTAAGFLFWSRVWRYRLNSFFAIVQNVWVDPGFRGGGVCDALFEALAKIPNLTEVRLAVAIQNIKAFRAYRRIGFDVTGYSMDCPITKFK